MTCVLGHVIQLLWASILSLVSNLVAFPGVADGGNGFGKRVARKTCHAVCKAVCVFLSEVSLDSQRVDSEEAEMWGFHKLRHQNIGWRVGRCKNEFWVFAQLSHQPVSCSGISILPLISAQPLPKMCKKEKEKTKMSANTSWAFLLSAVLCDRTF